MSAASFADITEEHHQVFRLTKTQKAQRDIDRQKTAIGAQAVGLEHLRAVLTGTRVLPQIKPTVHVQVRLEVDQRTLDHLPRRIAQHEFCRPVGITHATVPIDPENTNGALINRELCQSQRLFAFNATGEVFTPSQQFLLQRLLLTTLPDHDGETGQQHHQQ